MRRFRGTKTEKSVNNVLEASLKKQITGKHSETAEDVKVLLIETAEVAREEGFRSVADHLENVAYESLGTH